MRTATAILLVGLLGFSVPLARGESCLRGELERMREIEELKKRPLARWVQELQSPQVATRRKAARALGLLRIPQTAPDLARAMRDSDQEVRGLAIQAVGWMGRGMWYGNSPTDWFKGPGGLTPEKWKGWQRLAQEVVPSLLRALEARDHQTRAAAVSALAEMIPESRVVVPVLGKMLRDPVLEVRLGAAEALGRYGPYAQVALPDLVGVLSNGEAKTRIAAVTALARLAPATRDAIPALRLALGDPDPGVRYHAAAALGELGPLARLAVPDLARVLRDPVNRVRWSVNRALTKMGPAGVEVLVAAVRDTDTYARALAVDTLGQMKERSAIPALVGALEDPAPSVRGRAIEAFAEMGQVAREAVPELIRLFRRSPEHRTAVARCLRAIGPAAWEAVPALIAGLEDEMASVRYASAQALGGIGPAARVAVPQLIRASRDSTIRSAVLLPLGTIGDPAGIPTLVAALEDEHLRPRAALALRRLGPRAAPAVPALLSIYRQNRSRPVRSGHEASGFEGVCEALKTIAPDVARKAGVP